MKPNITATERHLPYASCHSTQVSTPTLMPARQAGTPSTYPGGMKGWVGLSGWLYTELVYLSKGSHPSKCRATG